jgi:hypothetical protein
MTTAFTFLAFALTTFVALPLAVFATAAWLIKPSKAEQLPLLLLTAPISPLVLALALMVLYSTPLRPSGLDTVLTVLIGLAAIITLGRGQICGLGRDLLHRLRQMRVIWSALDALLVIIAVLMVVQIATLPMMENDALEYMAVARHIFETKSLSIYPVLNAAPNGLFAPSSHPPAYHMYLVWGNAWLGVANFAPARLLALFNLIGMASLLVRAFYNHDRRTKTLSVFLMLSVPLYVTMLVAYHIDALRLLPFLAAAIAVGAVIDRPNTQQAVLTGALLGLAAFAHSIGILAWLFGGLAWLVLGPHDKLRNFRLPLIIGAVAFAVGGAQFVKNIIIYGVPLQDSAPIWEMAELAFGQDLKHRRDLLIPYDRFLFGVFRGFIEFPLFGLLFWLAALAVWRIGREWRLATVLEQVATLWIVSFLAISAITAIAGSDLVIKNPRYVLTIAPLLVVVATPTLAAWRPDARWSQWIFAGSLGLLLSWTLLQSTVRTTTFGARTDLWRLGERAPIYRTDNRFPGAPLYRLIEKDLEPGEKTLVFRQADFTLYGKGPWIDNFDTKLEPLYRLTTVEEAHAWLQSHKVRFFLVPPYTWPTFTRTMVGRLLGDQRLAEQLGDHRGIRLFRLRDAPIARSCTTLGEPVVQYGIWQGESGWRGIAASVLGLPFLSEAPSLPLGVTGGTRLLRSMNGPDLLTLSTDYNSTMALVTGEGGAAFPPLESWGQAARPGEELELALRAKGRGFLAIDVMAYPQVVGDGLPAVTRLWDGVLDAEDRTIELQVKLPDWAKSYRFVWSNVGRASALMELEEIRICRTSPPSKQQSEKQPRKLDQVVANWPSEGLRIGCTETVGGSCQPSRSSNWARQNSGDVTRYWGSLETISSAGFRPSWRFKMRAGLETARLWLRLNSTSTVAGIVGVPYRLIVGDPAAKDLSRHRLYLTASGIVTGFVAGGYTAYVQFAVPNGRVDWRYAGAFSLTEQSRQITLDVDLPPHATGHEIVLVGAAREISLQDLRLERLAGSD